MKALQIYAGPRALEHLRTSGLDPADIRVIPAAAGGPKGLTLLPLDRFIFGTWMPQSVQPVDLVGASIGAWRMAAACLNDPVTAFSALEHAYIHQQYDLPPGRKRPTRAHISERFSEGIRSMFGGRIHEVLDHSRYRLHVVTSRGRGILNRDTALRRAIGYAGAYAANAYSRSAMDRWLERAVFSAQASALPFATDDFRTRRYALSEINFTQAVQASCSIPFVLNAVHDIPGAMPGAYWDGGITDYHLHLDYRSVCVPQTSRKEEPAGSESSPRTARQGLVLYPHFQKHVVPGWLDKSLKRRHHASAFLDDVIVLAPRAEWVANLPNAKLPDRTDFTRFGTNVDARVRSWNQAVRQSEKLRDDFEQWLADGAPIDQVEPL
jgi:hypothetical protein